MKKVLCTYCGVISENFALYTSIFGLTVIKQRNCNKNEKLGKFQITAITELQ